MNPDLLSVIINQAGPVTLRSIKPYDDHAPPHDQHACLLKREGQGLRRVNHNDILRGGPEPFNGLCNIHSFHGNMPLYRPGYQCRIFINADDMGRKSAHGQYPPELIHKIPVTRPKINDMQFGSSDLATNNIGHGRRKKTLNHSFHFQRTKNFFLSFVQLVVSGVELSGERTGEEPEGFCAKSAGAGAGSGVCGSGMCFEGGSPRPDGLKKFSQGYHQSVCDRRLGCPERNLHVERTITLGTLLVFEPFRLPHECRFEIDAVWEYRIPFKVYPHPCKSRGRRLDFSQRALRLSTYCRPAGCHRRQALRPQ